VTSSDETLRALREALRLSPENIPLRQHLADTLLSYGRLEEAEQEYRAALSLAPQNQALKIGLAKSLYQQGKNSHCSISGFLCYNEP
jgi:predicted Zn-dependent protease